MKLILKANLLILLSVVLVLSVITPQKASAAFEPGRIIDDAVFENSTSMTATQIDSFLNSFPSSCISPNKGFQTPKPTGWSSAVSTNHGYTFGEMVSAGTAIYSAAQIYHINPQVLLATLQKEQSLVTGGAGCYYDTPSTSASFSCDLYNNGTTYSCTNACPYSGGCVTIAIGMGCPYYCDASYNGFSMQLIAGTWLLRFAQQRAYGNLTGYAGYDQYDENVYYSGAMTAGYRKRSASSSLTYYDGTYTPKDSSTITVQNGATAALYYYTPFISGNQSFYNRFTGWFGSTTEVNSWAIITQNAYTDSSKQTRADLGTLSSGKRYYLQIVLQNTGNTVWQKLGSNPTALGTSEPRDRNSPFCDSTWLGCNRPALIHEYTVNPGQYGSFEFWITTPTIPDNFNEIFAPMIENKTWMDSHTISFPMIVPPVYSWSLESQYAYADNTKTTAVDLTSLAPGQRVFIGFQAKNTGNVTWENTGNNPVRVGTTGPRDRNSPFCDSTWLSCNRSVTVQASTAPGQTGTFEFWYKAPSNGFTGFEQYSLMLEGLTWMNDPGMSFFTKVQ